MFQKQGNNNNINIDNDTNIDENLYSRQLYVLGKNAMHQITQSHILISGLSGLGVEIAKNIILSGVKEVVLSDTKKCDYIDLSTNYYLTKDDIGKNRAECCINKLKELNENVQVTLMKYGLLDNLLHLKKFSVIVLTDSSLEEQIIINKFTHSNNIKFINCMTWGLIGQVFCDFGENFLVKDIDGEEPKRVNINNITNEENAIVTCIEPHDMSFTDTIQFDDIKGMMEINGKKIKILECIDQFNIKIKCNTINFSKFDSNGTLGTITQIKQTRVINFKPLNESMLNPEFVHTNFIDFERPKHLHYCQLIYHQFIKEKTIIPDLENFEEFYELVNKYHNDNNDNNIDKNIVKKFLHCTKGSISSINSIIGGIVSQEIIKACSNKFHPINQWLYFDALNCLTDELIDFIKYEKVNYKKDRYLGQKLIFGNEIQNKLASTKCFIVGSGAIGCELLKQFAMMGIGTKDNGTIYITDMDIIEKSNLNRQFLFRNKDIGHSKSITAANAIKNINPELCIEAHNNRIGQENEHIYNEQFYKNLMFVANALDNVEARQYVDQQCVLNKIPLLESGTLGTKGNTQIIIPFLTESYGSTTDPPEKSIPVCTLKYFPYNIEHTIQYARDQFEGIFNQSVLATINYLENPDKIKNMKLTEMVLLSNNVHFILDNYPKNYDDCIKWAFNFWHEQYRDQIKDLLTYFPPNKLTKEKCLFWSGTKRCPKYLDFDFKNDLHIDYVYFGANLWAYIFNIEKKDRIYTQFCLSELEIPKYIPKCEFDDLEKEQEQKQSINNVNDNNVQSINNDKGNATIQIETKNNEIKNIINNLPKIQSINNIDGKEFKNYKLRPIEFEKDDDDNYHIDFITASSNLRAINYGIDPIDRHEIKKIAGKIIPAIPTTTAIVAGLITLELYKIIQNFDKIENYSNTFINLAIPIFAISEPIKAHSVEYKGNKYNLWNSFEIEGGKTLQELIDYFKNKYDIEIDSLYYETYSFYNNFSFNENAKKKLDMKIEDIINNFLIDNNENELVEGQTLMFTICVDDEIEDVDLPEAKYYVKF